MRLPFVLPRKPKDHRCMFSSDGGHQSGTFGYLRCLHCGTIKLYQTPVDSEESEAPRAQPNLHRV